MRDGMVERLGGSAAADLAEAWLMRLQEEIVTHLLNRRDRNRSNAA
jgi:hypothetical protein